MKNRLCKRKNEQPIRVRNVNTPLAGPSSPAVGQTVPYILTASCNKGLHFFAFCLGAFSGILGVLILLHVHSLNVRLCMGISASGHNPQLIEDKSCWINYFALLLKSEKILKHVLHIIFRGSRVRGSRVALSPSFQAW